MLFHSAMVPSDLKHREQEFRDRFDLAVIRYKQKWGNLPGYQGRLRILGGLVHAFRRGLIGNSSWGKRYAGIKGNLYSRRSFAERGFTIKEQYTYMSKLSQLARKARKAQEHERFIQERKRAREAGQNH